MGSSALSSSGPSKPFQTLFAAQADSTGTMSFAKFMQLALYHPQLGYYRADRARIGYGEGSDFYTASSSGPLFGELVSNASVTLLGSADAKDYAFVEIGAENARGILAGVDHPFGTHRVLQVGDPIEIVGPSVVFSNELLDAQPFRRFAFRHGDWYELGVQLHQGILSEVEMSVARIPEMPPSPSEGHLFDAPVAAIKLVSQIAAQPWSGVFIACDYGKSFLELSENYPAGTARAYYRHQQSNDLLARPGKQDLTCHICWDWIESALRRQNFLNPRVESQEAFFIHHASSLIASMLAAEATRFSQKKLALAQLLHPSHLGQKFQILHARRG